MADYQAPACAGGPVQRGCEGTISAMNQISVIYGETSVPVFIDVFPLLGSIHVLLWFLKGELKKGMIFS